MYTKTINLGKFGSFVSLATVSSSSMCEQRTILKFKQYGWQQKGDGKNSWHIPSSCTTVPRVNMWIVSTFNNRKENSTTFKNVYVALCFKALKNHTHTCGLKISLRH